MNQHDQSTSQTIAVSHPGGFAKQFRIQILDAANQDWRQHSAHNCESAARRQLEKLAADGWTARLIHYRMPSAA